MWNSKIADVDTVSTFGQRKIVPRVCIVDEKRHIRTFLAEALEELGFITGECAASDQLPALLDQQMPDLFVLGIPHDAALAGHALRILGARRYTGKVLLIGPRESFALSAAQLLGEETGLPCCRRWPRRSAQTACAQASRRCFP